jgi:hypothetical protein
MFAARLGRSPGETTAELKAVVKNVIKVLELDLLEHAMIGSPESSTGISAEAMKRVTMGVELVTDPVILFMDEPTSGSVEIPPLALFATAFIVLKFSVCAFVATAVIYCPTFIRFAHARIFEILSTLPNPTQSRHGRSAACG